MLINRIGLLYARSLGLQESQNHEICESAIAYVHHNVSKYHSQPTLTLTVIESTISFISGNVSVSIGCHSQCEHDNFHQVGIRNDNISVVSKNQWIQITWELYSTNTGTASNCLVNFPNTYLRRINLSVCLIFIRLRICVYAYILNSEWIPRRFNLC